MQERETTVVTEVEALVMGREFLKTHKWGRGTYHDNGAYCAIGALYCGRFGPQYWESGRLKDDLGFDDYDVINSAENLLNAAAPNGSITQFNDWQAKRKREVISIYNKAIKFAESKG